MRTLHEKLWSACRKLPEDYEPWGKAKRTSGDCSAGCKFFIPLSGKSGADWGICRNPESHRAGLLTFEHQGCPKFKQ